MFDRAFKHLFEELLEALGIVGAFFAQVLADGIDEVQERQTVVARRQLLQSSVDDGDDFGCALAVLVGHDRQRRDRTLVRVRQGSNLPCEISSERRFRGRIAAS